MITDHGSGGGRQGGGGGQQVVKEVNMKLVKEFNAGLAKLYLCKVKSWRWSWMEVVHEVVDKEVTKVVE